MMNGLLRSTFTLACLGLLATLSTACTFPGTSTPRSASGAEVVLNVFAAASLTAPMEEIKKEFEAAHPNTRLVINFAGSQQLAQQIISGAPADVFASANQQQMDALIEEGQIAGSASRPFIKNRLVVIFSKDSNAGLDDLVDLAKPGVKLILATREVPVGQYTLDFLDLAAQDANLGSSFKEGVLSNVVSYEDNVKAVFAKVALGEADAGIVYSSDVTGPDAGKVGQIKIPDAINIIATYPIAVLKDSQNPGLADEFVNLLLSETGQAILSRYGFMRIDP